MRIISGKYKRHNIYYIKNENTRPTTDKVRESVFNIITPYLKCGNCLDLFAGTGSLGLEALSRGYQKSYFVDKNLEAIKTINKNLEILNEKNGIVSKATYLEALEYYKRKEISFDLIFLDPPYRFDENEYEKILDIITKNNLLIKDGIIVIEHGKDKIITPNESNNLEIIKYVNYGIRNITILKRS